MGIISSSRFVNLNVTPCPSAIRTNLPALRSATIPLRHTLKTISCGQIPKQSRKSYSRSNRTWLNWNVPLAPMKLS